MFSIFGSSIFQVKTNFSVYTFALIFNTRGINKCSQIIIIIIIEKILSRQRVLDRLDERCLQACNKRKKKMETELDNCLSLSLIIRIAFW